MKKSQQDLIGRAITDVDFRTRLLADPDAVISADDYDISAEMMEQIRQARTMSPQQIDAAIATAAREGGVGA